MPQCSWDEHSSTAGADLGTTGVMFVNGFNLGWFWPDAGPATTMYVPGAILHSGSNELVLLAVMSAPKDSTGKRPYAVDAPPVATR